MFTADERRFGFARRASVRPQSAGLSNWGNCVNAKWLLAWLMAINLKIHRLSWPSHDHRSRKMFCDRGRRKTVTVFVLGLFCSHLVFFVRCDQAKKDREVIYRFANVTRSDTSVEIIMLCPEKVIEKTEDVKIVSTGFFLSRKRQVRWGFKLRINSLYFCFQMSLSYDESTKVSIVKNIESGSYLFSFKEDVNK